MYTASLKFCLITRSSAEQKTFSVVINKLAQQLNYFFKFSSKNNNGSEFYIVAWSCSSGFGDLSARYSLDFTASS